LVRGIIWSSEDSMDYCQKKYFLSSPSIRHQPQPIQNLVPSVKTKTTEKLVRPQDIYHLDPGNTFNGQATQEN